MNRIVQVLRKRSFFIIAMAIFSALIMAVSLPVWAQPAEPTVAIHVSGQTQALDPGNWWPSWHYFVIPESLEEALRSDGTPFVEVSVDISGMNGGLPATTTLRHARRQSDVIQPTLVHQIA